MGTQPPPPRKGQSPRPQFSANFCCGQTAECIENPLGMEVGLSPGDCVLDGTQPPSPKRGPSPPLSGPCLLWPNGCMDQDGTWHGGRPWSRPHCARWGPSCPPEKGESPPPIFGPSLLWPNGWMHQDATCMEVSLSPGDFVLDGDPAPTPKRGRSPQFSAHVYCDQTAAWIKMPFGTKLGLGLHDIVLDGDPAPPKKAQTPIFGQCPFCPNSWMD